MSPAHDPAAQPAGHDAPTLTVEEQIESLAQAIHEGDWMMVATEWRWCEASAQEKAVSYRRARAVLDAHRDGARDVVEFAGIIAGIDWTARTGSPGRLRAKAEKAVQWFEHRDRGWLHHHR